MAQGKISDRNRSAAVILIGGASAVILGVAGVLTGVGISAGFPAALIVAGGISIVAGAASIAVAVLVAE